MEPMQDTSSIDQIINQFPTNKKREVCKKIVPFSRVLTLRDALPYQNACFFIKFIKEGGRVKPVYKNFGANLVCYEKKAKKSEKNRKQNEKSKKALITLLKRGRGEDQRPFINFIKNRCFGPGGCPLLAQRKIFIAILH